MTEIPDSTNNLQDTSENLQQFYYNTIKAPDNNYTTEADHQSFLEQLISQRNCIQYHSRKLLYYRPVLKESLVKIYFHPEISMLIDIIQASSYKRRYCNILRFLLSKHIQLQFPHGDNHSSMMNAFLRQFATNTEGPKTF